jgi:hypothetical protein
VGAWGQIKILPATPFEVNGAFGQDENYGQDLRAFPVSFADGGFVALQKNRTEFVNFIYKPNSVLILALEYRHLFTVAPKGSSTTADHMNLAAGVHF